MKDTKYHCSKCNIFFPVRGIVAKELEKFNKKAFCPSCNSDKHTGRYKRTSEPQHRETQSSLNDPPSKAQIEYIKSLGGMPSKATTKGEAGAYITKLKKLRGN